MSKESLLADVRARLGVRPDPARREAVLARIAAHRANTVPARTRGTREALVAEFSSRLEQVQGSVERVPNMAAVPRAVARRLGENARVCLSPELVGLGLDFSGVATSEWAPKTSFDACITLCLGGAAETGTLVVGSSPSVPLTQHFLGELHIAILQLDQLVGSYEEIWDRLRQTGMPRHVTFISGPSCTGDIEMIMEYGAHGPRQLHVVLVEEA